MSDCWNAQVALWIYEDVAETIRMINSGSSQIATSPVKRLLGVRFDGPVPAGGMQQGGTRPMMGMMGGASRQMAGQTDSVRDVPNYVTPEKQSVLVPVSWTGRKGGSDYDVVHFAVSVVVDNRHVLDFMRELCSEKEHTFREDFKADGRVVNARRNQITILQNAVHVVDQESPAHELYRYGNGAAMRLDLVCEYLFIREGYDSIKPVAIKEQLGQTDVPFGDDSGMSFPGAGGIY
jgi:hypothetical protein